MTEGTISERLQKHGLDVEFLNWLEGEEDRLPRLRAVYKLSAEELAGAVRAAAWLRQLCCQPSVIAPEGPDEWDDRYRLLEDFLCAVLKESASYRILQMNSDLESLEHVLDTLLSKSAWKKYQNDIWDLRRRDQPPRLPKMPARRSGGKDESEETGRMRAAIAYVKPLSGSPYSHLAECWNEKVEESKYDPDRIKSRLRKGHYLNRTEDAAERLLDHWKSVYSFDLRYVFHGPFPLSQELEELLKIRRVQS